MEQWLASKPDSLFSFSVSTAELGEGMTAQLIPQSSHANQVIWQDGESQVIVHAGRLNVAITDGFVIFDVPLETDQTETGHLVVPLRMANDLKTASLTMSTEELPRGDGTLALRWGTIVQEQLWYGLLNLGEYCSKTHLQTDQLTLNGIYCKPDTLTFVYGRPVFMDEMKSYIEKVQTQGFDPGKDNFEPETVDMGSPGSVTPFGEPDECRQVLGDLCHLIRQLCRVILKAFRMIQSYIKKRLG